MKTRMIVPAIAAVAALGATPAVAYAAPAPAAATRQATPAEAKAVDIAWMKASAASDLFEIASGKQAVAKAVTNGPAALGAMFVKDHTAHLATLRRLAAARNVTLPTAPLPPAQAIIDKLEDAPAGLTWDRNWSRAQLSGHRASLIATGKARQVSRDGQVLAFERTTLGVVTMHRNELVGVLAIILPPQSAS